MRRCLCRIRQYHTAENAGDELPEGDMDEMTKEILNFFEEDK